ncbi:MAG: hypothetical protein ACOYB2_19935, partial [Limnohabitans sp.]
MASSSSGPIKVESEKRKNPLLDLDDEEFDADMDREFVEELEKLQKKRKSDVLFEDDFDNSLFSDEALDRAMQEGLQEQLRTLEIEANKISEENPRPAKRAILELWDDEHPEPKHFNVAEQILSARDRKMDNFLLLFEDYIKRTTKIESGTSACLSAQQKFEYAEFLLQKCSPVLAHKLKPMMMEVLANQNIKNSKKKFASIVAEPSKDEDLSRNYNRCFNAFLNDKNCVNFKAIDKKLLKGLAIKDAFILTFFTMNTTKRTANDNVLQLAVTGVTSVGKSLIFESPLQEVSHSVTSDDGVGRFNHLSDKTTCLMRDCNIDDLVTGKDVQKFKCIARSEPVASKIQSRVNEIQPMHLFVTSNRPLHNHEFAKRLKDSIALSKTVKSHILPTKKMSLYDIDAVRSRFIEVYVRKRPEIKEEFLPKSGGFTQKDMIRGLFKQIIS